MAKASIYWAQRVLLIHPEATNLTHITTDPLKVDNSTGDITSSVYNGDVIFVVNKQTAEAVAFIHGGQVIGRWQGFLVGAKNKDAKERGDEAALKISAQAKFDMLQALKKHAPLMPPTSPLPRMMGGSRPYTSAKSGGGSVTVHEHVTVTPTVSQSVPVEVPANFEHLVELRARELNAEFIKSFKETEVVVTEFFLSDKRVAMRAIGNRDIKVTFVKCDLMSDEIPKGLVLAEA